MAEAIAVISFVSAVCSLADYGTRVVKRLNEFKTNVHGLPQTFLHVSDQLPLLTDTMDRIHRQAKDGHLSPQTETVLRPVVEGIHAQLTQLDSVLVRVLPSAKASTWEKGIKAIRSLKAQKTVDDFASVIDRYISSLTVYQATHNGDLIKTLIKLIEQMNPPQLQDIQVAPPRKPYFMVRYQTDEDFIGREKIVEEIRRRFGRKNRVAIAGIGGVGKSRIAIEYCYQYRRNNPDAHVFWVHGGNKVRFEAAYQEMARTMKIPGFDDPKINTLQLVSDWLTDEDNGSWLMVLDNADDAEVWIKPAIQEASQQGGLYRSAPLIDYIPRGSHCFVLITTRNGQLGERLAEVKREKPIDVLPLVPEDAESLLRRKLSENDDISQEDANEITEALDYLPLAITQAAAYLDQNCITAAEYLHLFRDGEADTSELLEQDIYDAGRDYEIQNSIFRTWKISFDQILKQDPRAAEVLSLMAMLDRQAISENLLRKNEERKLKFNAAIQKLKAFSLITEEIKPSIFSMHRLVQLSTQMWLEHQNELSRWQEAALSTVAEYCPLNGNYENWISLEAISPHLQVVLDYQLSTKPCQLQRAKILFTLGWYNNDQGRYSIAYQHYLESLVLRESNLGPEHSDTLNSMNNLALVLQTQDRYGEAEKMHRSELEVTEKVLGPEHPRTLISMNNLAEVLRSQGNYDEAKKIHQRALKIMEKVLGPEHPSMLTGMNNLALVLWSQGNYDKAKKIHQQALKVREKVLGPEHPSTLRSMNNLAEVLRSQGNYNEAEKIHERALKIMEKVLGLEHPSTLTGMNSLAEVLRNQGNYDRAEKMHRRALEVREKVLGLEHSDALDSMDNLALVLRNHGRYGEAEKMHRRALEVRKKVLGPEHPGTLTSINNLALVLQSQGRYGEAEKMHRSELEVSEKVLGPEHPETLTSINGLAEVLRRQGNYDEAEKMNRRALEVREKVLGPEHPDTLAGMNNLALVLWSQGNYDEAKKIHQRELKITEKVLGPEHPSTLTGMNNLAGVLRSQGNYDEAEKMHRRALEVREKVLGSKHPDTLTSINNLAEVLRSQGNYDEAEKMHRRVLEVKEKVLGPEHPGTLSGMNNLAEVLRSRGNYDEAEMMHRRTLEVREKVLGTEHPDTLSSVYGLANLNQCRKQYDNASILYQRACSGYQKILGSDHPDTLKCSKDYFSMLGSLPQGGISVTQIRLVGQEAAEIGGLKSLEGAR